VAYGRCSRVKRVSRLAGVVSRLADSSPPQLRAKAPTAGTTDVPRSLGRRGYVCPTRSDRPVAHSNRKPVPICCRKRRVMRAFASSNSMRSGPNATLAADDPPLPIHKRYRIGRPRQIIPRPIPRRPHSGHASTAAGAQIAAAPAFDSDTHSTAWAQAAVHRRCGTWRSACRRRHTHQDAMRVVS
jgi:hypothetical protein